MPDWIDDVARECAEEWRPSAPAVEWLALTDLIAAKLRARLRPEGGVPVMVSVLWYEGRVYGAHGATGAKKDNGAGSSALRIDTITAYLVPPQPEPGCDVEGVAEG